MIFTEAKSKEKILKSLSAFEKIFIFGCGSCATKCGTGGEDEVKAASHWLTENGKKITGFFVIESPCDERLTKKALREKKKELGQAEAVLVLSCGSGVQTIVENLNIPAVPGLDSMFLAKIENSKNFQEKCSLCGDCILEETAGLCVITLCPKHLKNGPCGGSDGEKCEVNTESECVWSLIYKKLKKQNKLSQLFTFQNPQKFSQKIPGQIVKKL